MYKLGNLFILVQECMFELIISIITPFLIGVSETPNTHKVPPKQNILLSSIILLKLIFFISFISKFTLIYRGMSLFLPLFCNESKYKIYEFFSSINPTRLKYISPNLLSLFTPNEAKLSPQKTQQLS
ncbi:hypothetical protein FGO68_gene15119 [Halteria grandinella]|uniref:Uncharacterized protein n=1 Tax=Halteria grandinella TaxID=5974 RepID=A0A8J8NB66_HALGN|nr:hypothetical protein FGO68_gene15119 [Halteria grandinella]